MHPEVYLDAKKEDAVKPVVKEYFSGESLDAREVIWVADSDVVGPMGPALVPLKNQDDVEVFKKRHGGAHVFRLAELTDARWEAMTGKKAVTR